MYSNFKLTEENGTFDEVLYKATVIKNRWFRKPKTIELAYNGVFWYEVESGTYTNGIEIEELFKAFIKENK